ncbi:MAG: hypothetical protein DRN71_01800 [Candidatus Nanohalarchaeota archaeon]|nr:MAG: hypothetical protein DRN71_01800 [Candidatus Nanohaloarchaeota archaeon]
MNAFRMSFCVLFGLAALFGCFSSAFAVHVESADKFVLAAGDVVADDLIVTGGEIVIEGTIDGDLIAFGGNIVVSGDVSGDVLIAGGTIKVTGDVADDAVLAGGDIEISSDIGDNLLAACGSFKMGEDSSVGRDAILVGSDVNVSGDVSRNLLVHGSIVEIDGSVLGNVVIDSERAPRILAGAEIVGDVNYTCEYDIVVDEGASIVGYVNKKIPDEGRQRSDLEKFNARLSGFLSIFAVGFLLVRMLPVCTRNVCNNLKKSALRCGLWGAVGLVIVPVMGLFLVITIVGLPLALMLFFGYLLMIYVSKVYVSVFVGKFILNMTGSRSDSLVWMLFFGLLAFELAGLVPGVSGFVSLLVLVFGFGAIMLTKKEMYAQFRKKKLV